MSKPGNMPTSIERIHNFRQESWFGSIWGRKGFLASANPSLCHDRMAHLRLLRRLVLMLTRSTFRDIMESWPPSIWLILVPTMMKVSNFWVWGQTPTNLESNGDHPLHPIEDWPIILGHSTSTKEVHAMVQEVTYHALHMLPNSARISPGFVSLITQA